MNKFHSVLRQNLLWYSQECSKPRFVEQGQLATGAGDV